MNDYVGKDEPLTILLGNNFGRTTWVSQVPVARLVHSASCPKELERFATIPVNMIRSTARQILFGLVKSAQEQRLEQGAPILPEFAQILSLLHVPSLRTLRPFVVHIEEIAPDNDGIRTQRIFWHTRETLGFRVYLPPEYSWRIMSGHSDVAACCLALEMCDTIVRSNCYPDERFFPRVKALSENELTVWLEALACSHSFTKVAVEFYLGMSPEEERDVAHGLLANQGTHHRAARAV
ncbi:MULTISPECIES: hypothetical protein [Rhizobium]|uniref:Uncharacterized protein n=1 Tax=Rhizobium binae TaxID=1138190 RepID=A0ABV2MKZ3_9HYPH|nr:MULTISPECIES: hypothetical protein [Rhizobium]NKL49615.1 hypothetical protein [Rhizobium leguminosarum bv. viciae]MBX4937042.1 hypothetical protein [Rhizobium binae]MBX4943692.1 hypothetical protein [Rhizobium binae]MBX4979136.1 hypothetical protein [Rhizobium binae]MBX4995873.1 hypothetical protein [Rhizobium binae]